MSPARAARGRLTLCLLLAVLGAGAATGQTSAPRNMALEGVLDGPEDQELRWPTAVAAASPDEVAVADAFRPRLLVFRRLGASWKLAWVADLPGAPVGLAHDGRRWLASMRQGAGLVEVSQDGVTPIDLPTGVVPGALAAVPGGLLVHDTALARVLRLDRDGGVAGQTAIEPGVTGLAADAAGGFAVALGDRSTVLRFDADDKLTASWTLPPEGPVPAWPAGLAFDPAGRLFVVDRHNGRILTLDADGRWIGVGGRQGWDPGLLRRPAGIARLPDGRLLVADQGNGRAQLFRQLDGGTP